MAKKHYEMLLQDGKIVGVGKNKKYLSHNFFKRGRTSIWLKSMDDALQVLANAAAGEFGPITAREAISIEEVTQDTFLDASPEAIVYVRDIVRRLEDNRKALRDTQIRSGLPTLNSPEDGKVLFGAIIAAEKVNGYVLTQSQPYLGTENGVAYVWANNTTDAIEELGSLEGSASWVSHADEMGVVGRPRGVRYGRLYEDIPELTANHIMSMVEEVRVLDREDASRERTRRLNIERGFDSVNTPDDGRILYGAFVEIFDDVVGPGDMAVYVWANSDDDAETRLKSSGFAHIENIEEVGNDGMFGM